MYSYMRNVLQGSAKNKVKTQLVRPSFIVLRKQIRFLKPPRNMIQTQNNIPNRQIQRQPKTISVFLSKSIFNKFVPEG